MRDVAERAGVSVMTVSLALRGGRDDKRVSPETLERVREVAAELGYTHNARARALRLGRTNVIGLYAGHGYVNVRIPFFTEVVSGLQEGCEEVKRDLLLHGVFHGTSEEAIMRELADGRIDGLIVTLPQTSSLVPLLANSSFAVVSIADDLPGVPSVVVDEADGARQIAEHLYGLGHRSVVYVTSADGGIVSAETRMARFVEVADELGIRLFMVRPSATGIEVAQLAQSTGASAVVAWNDLSAFRLLSDWQRAGIRVPRDLSLVGFDGVPLPYGLPNPLTTVAAPWAEVAKTAVRLLDDHLNGRSVPSRTQLPVRLVAGTTTGPARPLLSLES